MSDLLKLSTRDRWRYLQDRFVSKIALRHQWVRTRIDRQSIALSGAYFSSNIGDRFMGDVLYGAFQKSGIDCLRVSHGSVEAVGPRPAVIMGGGELGDESYFRRMFSVASPEKVFVIGTSPHCALHEAPGPLLQKIRRIPFFCVRSRWAESYMRNEIGVEQVCYAPDLVFSGGLQSMGGVSQKGVCGVNILPFYCEIHRDGCLRPSVHLRETLARSDPDFASRLDIAHRQYMAMMKGVLDLLARQYREVRIIPFSVGDFVFSRSFFAGSQIKILSPPSSLDQLLSEVSACELFIPTRFHALVSAMIAGVPFRPVLYSAKCVNLLSDLGVTVPGPSVDRRRILDGEPLKMAEELVGCEPIVFHRDRLAEVHAASVRSVNEIVAAVSHSGLQAG
ncbi:polysaccharide pyruvyl transferase family protein [Alienimonas chondri]|uniref:Polysaccharide pyruvyl transferase domain-containing protein n=1 Tax=Alienimonas chondri TaxID=2681879 RepID=A0ABX1VES5_9PLAN|nr:hypothetical protein [Alienimonas chondri]